MTKNDYIEKITQNLEHLTKDELKDVATLTNAQFGVRLKVAEKEYWGKEIINLKSQLQQQALSVVPECVAGAIESIPDHYSAFEAIDLIKSKVEILTEENKDWLPVYNWLCEGVENQDVFALAFITRKYQVEKPQLFYLKNKLTTSYLALDINTGYYEHWGEEIIPKLLNKQGYKTSFTQQEIDSMETGSYEQIEVVE